jgi:hypothetical protein
VVWGIGGVADIEIERGQIERERFGLDVSAQEPRWSFARYRGDAEIPRLQL